MDSVMCWQDLRSELRGKRIPIVGAFEAGDFGGVSDGLKCFQSLYQVRADYDFLTCQVSLAEMHRAILNSRAAESMIRRRVPWSLRNKRPLIVHRTVLKNRDYTAIDDQLREFFDCLSLDHGIKIQELEVSGYGVAVEDILLTAKAIWSRVLMETMDAYIFAAAIECEADFFLTGDSVLRQAVTKLNNPTDEWTFVERAIRNALGKSRTFKFPMGVAPSYKLR